MARRPLNDKEKEILERIGSSKSVQRSRAIVDMYESGDEKEIAAYEQSNADRNFRQRASRLTMQQFEKEFADIEKQKQQLEKEKGSLRDALKPGGITPSEWWDNRKEKNAEIKALESKEGKYRAVYDEKKSREETDMLPDDVKGLLDRYNALDTGNKGIDLQSMFIPAEHKSHTQINSQKLRNEQQKLGIAEELKKRGYHNYEELAEYRRYITESEGTDEFTKEMADFTEKHPIASTAANLGLMPARIVTGAVGQLDALDNKTELRNNPKSGYNALTRANREKREVISENIEDGVLSADFKRFIYETADSALESLAAGTLFGPAGGAMLGLSAMNESVIDSLESGATNEQAFVNGIAAGAFEAIFESVSLGRLRALKEVPVKTIKDAIKNIGKSVLVNFSEEANTEFANLMFDYLYNGGASQYYEAVTALIGQGYSEKEARNRVILDMSKQVGMAGLGGALMGSTFGAYGSAAGAVNYNSQLKDTGRQIIEYDNAESLLAGVKDVQDNDKLRALAEEIVLNEQAQRKAELEGKISDAKSAVSDAEAFRIEKKTEYKRATGKAAVDAAKVYKASAKDVKTKKAELRSLQKEAGKVYSKKDYRNVGRAAEFLAEQTDADMQGLVKKAVSKRLEKVGESNATVADAIVKKAKGEQLTKKEQTAYNSSKKALQVYRELVGDTYDAEWARNLNKEVSELIDRRYNAKVDPSTATRSPSPFSGDNNSSQQKEEYEQKVEDYKGQLKEALHRDGQDKEVLDAAVDLCFEYGRNGGYTLQEAIGSEHISDRITPEQRQHAYEAGVYQGVKDTANVRYKGDAVDVFVEGFRGKDNNARRSYTSSFDVFYSEGMHTDKSFDAVVKENSSLLKFIDSDVAEKAFNVGRKQADNAEPSAPSRKKPTAKGEYNSKTVEEKEVDVFFESLAKKLGVNITRVQSLTHNGRKTNAYIDIGKGEIVSSASSDNEYQSTIHEVVHYGYAYNSPKMRPIAKAVKEYFIGKHSAADLEEILLQYEKQYGADRAAAEEEFVADCLAGMFSTDEGVNDFLAWLENESGYSAQEKKTVLQKLADWILEIIDAVQELLQGESLNKVVAEFAKEETARLKEIRKLFLEALDEAVDGSVGRETKSTAEGGVKMSFAGVKAKTSDIGTLEQAQRLEDVGKASAEEIRQQTGWFRGMDGKWRFELDDSQMKIRDIDITSGETKLVEVLDHPALFKAYPQLKDITVSAFPSIFRFGVNGSYNSERKEISLSDEFLVNTRVQKELAELKASPEYREYKERLEKAAREHGEKRLELSKEYKKISQTEEYRNWVDLYYQLDDVESIENLRVVEKEWKNSELGKRYYEIQAELKRLDEVNPQAEIEKEFRESKLGKRYRELEWDISGKELTNNKDTRNTLIHEIQHAIQDIEGFASGASPNYWLNVNKDKNGYTPSEMKRLEAVQKRADDYYKMIVDEDIKDDAYRLWYLNDHYFDDNVDSEAVDKEIAEIEARGEAFGYTDILDRYFELQSDVTKVFNEIEKRRRRSPDELYHNTAGEIEARDSTARLEMSSDERKNTRPDIDRKDVVFAEGGVSYSKASDNDKSSIKKQIKDNIDLISKMNVVADVTYKPQNKKDLKKFVVSEFKKIGFKVERQNFGIVEIGEKQIDKSLDYVNTEAEKAALLAVPKVIKRGTLITERDDHKGRAYDTLTIAAPVSINGVRGNMGVVIRMTGKNRYHTHRILMPDGSEFKFETIKKDPELTSSDMFVFSDDQGTDIGSVSNNSITDSSENVKTSLDWIDFAEEKEKERSLASEVTELKKMVEELRGKIQHPGVKHIVSKLAVQKVAKSLKSGYMSKINLQVLTDELFTFYGYMANENGLSWDNVQIYLESIATKILDESKFKNPDVSEYAKSILRDIKGVKIKLNEKQKNAVTEKYGSYNEFRKRMMGTLVLSEEGTSLDERWQELADDYPYLFDIETSDVNQPLELVEIVSALCQTYEDSYGMDYDSAKDMLMAEIYEQYFEVPETKYISEEYAVKLARAKADYNEKVRELKAEFKRQKDEAYKKARAEYAESLKGIREEQKDELLKIKARYNLRAQNMADTRIREKKRAVLTRGIKRLDKLLRNPGKGAPSAGVNKYGKEYVHLTNIPEAFRKAVVDYCSIFINHDAGVFSGVVKSDSVTVKEKKVEQLRKIYAIMQNSDSYLSQTVAEEMQAKIDTVAEIVAERRIAELTAEELDTVIEVTDYITASINAQVAVWVEGKKSTVEAEGRKAIEEFKKLGRNSYLGGSVYKAVKGWGVNNYKPAYFFERVGGPLEKLFLAIQNDGQRAYARNVNAAAAFMESINKKYDYRKWQDEKELVLETVQGHRLKLTKAQAMHIYATARREALAGKDAMHLMEGGIVFESEIEADVVETKEEEREEDRKAGKKVRKTKLGENVFKYKAEDGDAHRIHFDDVTKISEYLTAEQKAFIDECVNYLSVDMAALGNEISMEIYGIKRFNEKYYIPYNSAKNFIYRKMGENGNAMLKNKSFTKETVFGANNPLVVGDFLKVITSHIEEMSMYNAMVLPLDYFNRVWNYNVLSDGDDPTDSRRSVQSAMQTAFGSEYVAYVEQFLEDVNGGINSDAREKAVDKLMSKFKKTAVLGSASVVIQQPSAVVRAFAEIDPKYFVTTTFAGRKKAWENALKYSSTALLKDIGGFDTVSGQGTVDWLTKTEYKGKDKVLKLFTDSQYRDDVLAWGPGFADKVTWAHIWLACEKEVRANNRGLSGENLYEAVGKRFDEVINKTQVYDSVLSRSAHMRSKSSMMKTVTAFMSEPTVQANMLASAAFDFKNVKNDKEAFGRGMRKIASVALSQLFNAALVSIIYAARDDEEDETLAEKYISEVVNNFLGSLNPLSMVPLYKDVVSIMQGFDVKRPDMNVISKFVDAVQKAFSKNDKLTVWDRSKGLVGAVGDIWGIPVSNLIREGEAVYNVAKSIKGIKDTTGKGIVYAISDDFAPELQKLDRYEPSTKDERLYYAFRDNDEKMYNRLAEQYKTGGEIKSALREQIEEGYIKERLTEDEAMAQFRRLGFSENEAYYEVRKLKEPVDEEESEDANAAFKSFSEMQGIQSEADAELEAERQDAADEGKEFSEDADYTWLRDKLKAGDKDAIKEEINLLKEKGVSDSKIAGEVKKWLKENDSDVKRQAEQSLKGNFSGYESAVKRIADKYGVDESAVASAIRGAAGSDSDPVEGTVYALGDLHFAIDKGNEQTVRSISSKIYDAKLKIKLAEGEDYDKAYKSVRAGIRTSLSSKWKDEYVAGNSTVRAQIRRQFWATGMYDSLTALDEALYKWREGK